MPRPESSRSTDELQRRRQRPRGASPGRMPSCRLTNELGSSPSHEAESGARAEPAYPRASAGHSPARRGIADRRRERREADAPPRESSRRIRAASCGRRTLVVRARRTRRRSAARTPRQPARRTTPSARRPASTNAPRRNTRARRTRSSGQMSHPDSSGSERGRPRRAPASPRGSTPLSDLVLRRVDDAVQPIAGHERIHVMQLVRVEMEQQRRQPRRQPQRSREVFLLDRRERPDRSPWLTCCGMCVCWLRSSTSSATRLRSQRRTDQSRTGPQAPRATAAARRPR